MASNSEYAKTYYERGNAYLEKGEYDRAITAYSKAIELKPDYADAWYNRGICYNNKVFSLCVREHTELLQLFNLAILNFDEVLVQNPDHADAWYMRGRTFAVDLEWVAQDLWDFVNNDEALRSYNEALRIAPDSINVLLSRGRSFVKEKEYDRAIDDFKAVLRIDPENEKALIQKRKCYVAKGEFDTAIEDISILIEANPDNAEYWCQRAGVWCELWQYDLMTADYKEAIKRDPSCIAAYRILGEFYCRNLKPTENDEFIFIELFNKALSHNPCNAELYELLGNIYKWCGKDDKAIEAYNESLKCNNNTGSKISITGYKILGKFYKQFFDYPKAEKVYLDALKYNPDNAELYQALGTLYQNMGKSEEAMDALTKALKYASMIK